MELILTIDTLNCACIACIVEIIYALAQFNTQLNLKPQIILRSTFDTKSQIMHSWTCRTTIVALDI